MCFIEMANIMLLLQFVLISLVTAKGKIPITMVTSQSFNAESRSPYPEYYCYLNSPDADSIVTARRVWDTRSGMGNNPAPPSPQLIPDVSYPAGSAVYRVSLFFNNNSQSYAFGTFSCEASKEGRKDTSVSNILMNSNGTSSPADRLVTQTVDEGATGVEIRMNVLGGYNVLEWYKKGTSLLETNPGSAASDGTLSLSGNVQKNVHEGVYEAVTSVTKDPRMQPLHGLKRLIVRSCAANHWGPPDCTGICDNCYNGGVCDDETGRCICPPGFMGSNCLIACGGNRFGYSCEFQCSYDEDDEVSCSGLQFCLLDPFGCRCNTGWEDLSCDLVCSNGTFGASCLQDCHCEGLCDRFTGVCDGTCEAGWNEGSCQIPDICPTGFYGSTCIDKCYCKNNGPCDKITGSCPSSQCTPGYVVYTRSPICQECRKGFFGESCLQVCRCDADACNKVTGDCSGQCKPQWVDTYQCLAGLQNASSSRINPNATSYVSCVTQIYRDSATVLTVKLSRESDQVVNNGIMFVVRENMGNTEVWRFTADGVREGEKLFCLVLDQGNIIVARLNTIVMEYDLPVLRSLPVVISASASSVTIRWRAWDPDRDDGDPPVVAYILHHREAASDKWISNTVIQSQLETLDFRANNLESDTEYSFSIAAVREGEKGEGPRGPSVTVRTNCTVSDFIPISIMAHENTTTLQVIISWQIPEFAVCSAGISFSLYYEKSGSLQLLSDVEANSRWFAVDMKNLGNGEFMFYVLLTVQSETARSPWSNVVYIEEVSSPASTAVIVVISLLVVVAVTVSLVIFVIRFRKKVAFFSQRFRKNAEDSPRPHSVQGVVYENAGVSNEPDDYCNLDKDANKRQPVKYEYTNWDRKITTEDSLYEPVESPNKNKRNQDKRKENDVNRYDGISLQTIRKKLEGLNKLPSPVTPEHGKKTSGGNKVSSKEPKGDAPQFRKPAKKSLRPGGVEGTLYENAGISSDPGNYFRLDKDENKKQPVKCEVIKQDRKITTEDSLYEPIESPNKNKEKNDSSKLKAVNYYEAV